ncbi:Hypothetical predicted protein [Cloeon dipterum]|uniref:Uncharacterized protein n=1 Tax=Cloeon dipterum TaxID=197152 RepID=A0A8S1E914_9INSE|nr:Hypothetical predicted protein [Cloeon dipterum]
MQIYVNKSNNSGVTPLMVALYNNNPDVVEELCKHGAVSKEVLYKIYEDNHLFACTPILLAIKAGNVCAVEKLCQLGANLSVTYNGVNLVHQCIYLDNLDVAKLLCSFSDTLVSVKSPIGGKTALHVAAELGNDRFCEWLVEEEGVDVKEKTAKGETAADLVPWFNLHLLKYLKIVALK